MYLPTVIVKFRVSVWGRKRVEEGEEGLLLLVVTAVVAAALEGRVKLAEAAGSRLQHKGGWMDGWIDLQ